MQYTIEQAPNLGGVIRAGAGTMRPAPGPADD